MKPTDLVIIKPGAQKKLYGILSDSLSGLEPPLWAALLAAFIKEAGYRVNLIDAEIEPEKIMPAVIEDRPRLIAIVVSGTNPSASTMNMAGVRSLLEDIKEKTTGIPTILIGLHPSALPEKTLKEESVQMVCKGEGFRTLLDLLSGIEHSRIGGLYYKENGLIKSNPMAELVDPNDLPMPAWDLLSMHK